MIYPGYLALETHPDKPGIVKMVRTIENPRESEPLSDGGKVRFVLHFNDLDRGFMLAQTRMSRHIEDLDNNLYKRNLAVAMADIETVELKHSPVWKDPDLTEEELAEMDQEIQNNHRWITRRDRFVAVLKWGIIIYLLINLFAPLLTII
jgi:hypothetical protein